MRFQQQRVFGMTSMHAGVADANTVQQIMTRHKVSSSEELLLLSYKVSSSAAYIPLNNLRMYSML
jgi:hypothetical protein